MKKQLQQIPGVKKITKTAQILITGGYLSNIPCRDNSDCFAFSQDFADRCNRGWCEIR